MNLRGSTLVASPFHKWLKYESSSEHSEFDKIAGHVKGTIAVERHHSRRQRTRDDRWWYDSSKATASNERLYGVIAVFGRHGETASLAVELPVRVALIYSSSNVQSPFVLGVLDIRLSVGYLASLLLRSLVGETI